MFFTYGVREVSVRNCILFRDAVYVFTLHSFGKLLSLPDWYTSSPPRLTWTNLFPFCLSDPLRSVSHYVHHLTIWFRTICVSVCVKNPQECNKIHTYTHSWWLHLLNHTLCTWAIWFSEITDFTLFAVVFLLAFWCMSIIYTNTYNHVYMCASVYASAMWVSPHNAGFFRCYTSFLNTQTGTRTQELWFDLTSADEYNWDLLFWVRLNVVILWRKKAIQKLISVLQSALLVQKVFFTVQVCSLWNWNMQISWVI